MQHTSIVWTLPSVTDIVSKQLLAVTALSFSLWTKCRYNIPTKVLFVRALNHSSRLWKMKSQLYLGNDTRLGHNSDYGKQIGNHICVSVLMIVKYIPNPTITGTKPLSRHRESISLRTQTLPLSGHCLSSVNTQPFRQPSASSMDK